MADTPTWRHLFSRMRVVCVSLVELSAVLRLIISQTLEAMTKRQAHVLENHIWRQFATESSSGSALDAFCQVMADIPATLERAVALPSILNRRVFLNEAAKVAQSALAMARLVEFWPDEFWKTPSTTRFWSTPSRAANPADVDPLDRTFPFCFEFESLSVAVTTIMSWSVAAQLYSNVIQIHNLVQARLGPQIEFEYLLSEADITVANAASPLKVSSQNPLEPTASNGYSIEEIQSAGTRMARYVCQSLEYFHQIDLGTYGGHATTYPSWSARHYFHLHPGHERERSWLQNIDKMEGPGMRWGVSMMTFTDDLEPLGGYSA
jgi:hypothetical protein